MLEIKKERVEFIPLRVLKVREAKCSSNLILIHLFYYLTVMISIDYITNLLCLLVQVRLTWYIIIWYRHHYLLFPIYSVHTFFLCTNQIIKKKVQYETP